MGHYTTLMELNGTATCRKPIGFQGKGNLEIRNVPGPFHRFFWKGLASAMTG